MVSQEECLEEKSGPISLDNSHETKDTHQSTGDRRHRGVGIEYPANRRVFRFLSFQVCACLMVLFTEGSGAVLSMYWNKRVGFVLF